MVTLVTVSVSCPELPAGTGRSRISVHDSKGLPDPLSYHQVNCRIACQLAGVKAGAYSATRLEIGERLNTIYQLGHTCSRDHEAVRASGELVLAGRAIPLQQVAGAIVLQAGVE